MVHLSPLVFLLLPLFYLLPLFFSSFPPYNLFCLPFLLALARALSGNVDYDSCKLAVGFHYWRQLLMEEVSKELRCTFFDLLDFCWAYNKLGDDWWDVYSVAVCTELGCDRATYLNLSQYCHYLRSACRSPCLTWSEPSSKVVRRRVLLPPARQPFEVACSHRAAEVSPLLRRSDKTPSVSSAWRRALPARGGAYSLSRIKERREMAPPARFLISSVSLTSALWGPPLWRSTDVITTPDTGRPS